MYRIDIIVKGFNGLSKRIHKTLTNEGGLGMKGTGPSRSRGNPWG